MLALVNRCVYPDAGGDGQLEQDWCTLFLSGSQLCLAGWKQSAHVLMLVWFPDCSFMLKHPTMTHYKNPRVPNEFISSPVNYINFRFTETGVQNVREDPCLYQHQTDGHTHYSISSSHRLEFLTSDLQTPQWLMIELSAEQRKKNKLTPFYILLYFVLFNQVQPNTLYFALKWILYHRLLCWCCHRGYTRLLHGVQLVSRNFEWRSFLRRTLEVPLSLEYSNFCHFIISSSGC